jgi:hypothetical protein
MSRFKKTSKAKRRRKAVTAALGVVGALSLASSASASNAPTGDISTHTAPIIHHPPPSRRIMSSTSCGCVGGAPRWRNTIEWKWLGLGEALDGRVALEVVPIGPAALAQEAAEPTT